MSLGHPGEQCPQPSWRRATLLLTDDKRFRGGRHTPRADPRARLPGWLDYRQPEELPLTALASITSSTMDLDDLTRVLLIGSLVLLVAVAAVRLSVRSGLPSLLIYLGI